MNRLGWWPQHRHNASMQVVEHNSPLGAWRFAFAQPDARLAAHVERYVCYRESGTAFVARHELPITSLVLIINLGAPLEIVDTLGQRSRYLAGQGFAAGLSDSYARSETGGAQEGVQIFFTPLGARRCFGLPLGELTNRVVRLEDLFGSDAARLAMQLQETEDWHQRFALLDHNLLQRVHGKTDNTGRDILWAWRLLRQSHGGLSIASLSQELGYSRKHLAARFHDQIGLTPKLAARLFRFQHALALLGQTSLPPDWSDLAQAAGYYDQSHLIRDFRQFSGLAPGDFLRQQLPDSGGLAG